MDDLLIEVMLVGSGVTKKQIVEMIPKFEIRMGKAYTDKFKQDAPRRYVYALIDMVKQSQK
jgi:hypothetical protein